MCYSKFGEDRLEKVKKRSIKETESESGNSSGNKQICPPRPSLVKQNTFFLQRKLWHTSSIQHIRS